MFLTTEYRISQFKEDLKTSILSDELKLTKVSKRKTIKNAVFGKTTANIGECRMFQIVEKWRGFYSAKKYYFLISSCINITKVT